MKTLIDFLPILLFFGVYKAVDIYAATAVLMAATVAQMALLYRLEGKLATLHKVTLGMVLAFGALTLLLQDERFIKWKPTVLYTALGLGLGLALWVWKKNVLHGLLGGQLQLPQPVWNRLNLAWVVYCLFMAALNAYVAAFYSTDAWMNFKLWGYAFPLVFLVGQGVYVARYLRDDAPPA